MQSTLASSPRASSVACRGASSNSSSSSRAAALVPPAAAAAAARRLSPSASAKLASPQRVSPSSVVARAATPSTTILPIDSVAPTPKKGEKVSNCWLKKGDESLECR